MGIPFAEIIEAYKSIMNKIQNLQVSEAEYDWITNIELDRYNSNINHPFMWNTIAWEVKTVLQSIPSAYIDNLYNTKIARFTNPKFISIPVQKTLTRWKVFIEIIEY